VWKSTPVFNKIGGPLWMTIIQVWNQSTALEKSAFLLQLARKFPELLRKALDKAKDNA
jgi:hypothetical protein